MQKNIFLKITVFGFFVLKMRKLKINFKQGMRFFSKIQTHIKRNRNLIHFNFYLIWKKTHNFDYIGGGRGSLASVFFEN